MKKKREKPKYNTWQNSVYVIKNTWVRDKVLLFIILTQIILSVSSSTLGIFLPKTVVEQITDSTNIIKLVLTVGIFTIATAFCNAALSFLGNVSEPKKTWLRSRLCIDIMNKGIETDYANTEKNHFSELRQKVDLSSYGYKDVTVQIFERFKGLGINLLGFIVYMTLLITVNPIVLIVTAVTTILGFLAKIKADKWQFAHDYEYHQKNIPLWYLSNIAGRFNMAKDIRLFNMKKWIDNVHKINLNHMFEFRYKERVIQFKADIIGCAAGFIQLGISYGYLIWAVLYNGLSVGDFVLLFAAISGFSGWVSGIMREITTISEYSLHYCRIREYLEYPDIFKRVDGEPVPKFNNYTIELKNVEFRYEDANKNTLENINLTIKAGENLAIVGLNGAGKTTLVKLLCGFYDPTKGQVLLNGHDIRKFNRKEYYKLFTAVFQDFNILPLSIAENISQLTDKDIDRERVHLCIEQADLTKKISSLPDGIDTLLIKDVNDNAAELSGGETQKLMLARALYKNAPLLVLDEPTAALDPIAESQLYEKYNSLSSNKTSLYISHRLASTRFCDRIILIDGKKITEQGSHEELMKLNGKYAEMFNIQSKYYKDKEGEAV